MKGDNADKKRKRLVLLDAHAILHRGYHALPAFSSSKGEPTGALFGLSSMLLKIISDLKPDFIAACYDMAGPTFRHEAYEGYKAKRPKAEDDLIAQMKRSRDVFKALNIPIYEREGFEADDILGTIVEELKDKLKKKEIEIIIASGDMDTLQLVSGEAVRVYTLKKGINDTVFYDEEAVVKRFGFSPELLPDFKGLRGDPSDNIIGVKGVGEKTATVLIQNFGSIEDIYKTIKKDETALAEKGVTPRLIQILKENEEEALFSKTLATIRTDAPISFTLPSKSWREALDLDQARSLFYELEFKTLSDRLGTLSGKSEEGIREEAPAIPREEVEETALALWLVDSNKTNPSLEDIYIHTGTKKFSEAKNKIFQELKEKNLERVYRDIELPLAPLLREAETRGIRVNVSYLKELSNIYRDKLEALEKKIWKEAGTRFNINSSQQLASVLFDHLKLSRTGLKKTEGGARSTRESELLKLQGAHPIIDLVLEFREFQKLLSTYIDAIPPMVLGDGRLHTTFVQTGTTTGRISSKNPNMQNIPAQGEHGGEIRKAFIAEEGFFLVAFDYSQIELRILAILSRDSNLVRILSEGGDIHASVASKMFGVSPEEVTKDMRRKAKTINFGIIYGMGVGSLAASLKVSREEAQAFYAEYFKTFPGVAKYMEEIKRETAERGYTETLFGRRRYIEGIHSNIPYIRAASERMAINAPIQGTATGDVIKRAIIRGDKALQNASCADSVFLLLQVHDELVYEIKKEILERAVPIIKKAMELVLAEETNFIQEKLPDVPLIVDVSAGENWGSMQRFKI